MKEKIFAVSVIKPHKIIRVRADNAADALIIASEYGYNAASTWLSFGTMGIDYTESDIINNNTKTPQP